jgi:hypothetical protein
MMVYVEYSSDTFIIQNDLEKRCSSPMLLFHLRNVKKKKVGLETSNQNSIHEEIKSRLKSGNACYHSVQNLLSSSLLSKNVKIKIYRTNLAGCFIWL